MITVPACEEHNNGNSKDVEYVRNILTAPVQVNEIAQSFMKGKVGRSYDRSPKLLNQTFRNMKPVVYHGERTAAFDVDLDRLENVVRAIAYGIYWHQYSKTYFGAWVVLASQFIDIEKLGEEPQEWMQLKHHLRRIELSPLNMPEPRVFQAGVYAEDKERVVYGFVFFEGIIIHAVGYPFWNKLPGRGRPTRTKATQQTPR